MLPWTWITEVNLLPSKYPRKLVYLHENWWTLPWKLVEASMKVELLRWKWVDASMEADGNFHGNVLKNEHRAGLGGCHMPITGVDTFLPRVLPTWRGAITTASNHANFLYDIRMTARGAALLGERAASCRSLLQHWCTVSLPDLREDSVKTCGLGHFFSKRGFGRS